MSVSAEWVGIVCTAVGAAIGCGRLWQKVSDNSQAHERCERRREEMEQRIFDELHDVAESVNKIKGKLDIHGD